MGNLIVLETLEESMKLDLSIKRIGIDNIKSYDIVYQDSYYNIKIEIDIDIDEISNVHLFTNDQLINVLFDYDEKNKVFSSRTNINLFNMIYGITDMYIEVERYNLEPIYLFTGHIVVAIPSKYTDTMNSVHDMLEDIYKKNHKMLNKNKMINVVGQNNYENNIDDMFQQQIKILKSIIKTYNQNFVYFLKNPQFKSKQIQQVDTLKKVRSISEKNIRYIATHTEFLKVSEKYTGIIVNGRYMIPEKTLIDSKQFDLNIYENVQVISFLKYLNIYVDEKILKLKKILEENKNNLYLNKNINSNYILSTTIIKQYTEYIFNEYFIILKDIKTQINKLFFQYKQVLKCSIVNIRNLPKPTPIFLGIYHYRKIFECINLWFSSGEFELPKEKVLLNFLSADIVYEYFCLLHLYDSIVKNNYSEVIEKREAYKYESPNNKYLNTNIDNTYYFVNDDSEIVLYYQPVIYSYISNQNNNINLFRTDRSFYTPDFIIKLNKGSKEKYFIIDAKWRNRNILLNNGVFEEVVYKYYYSIVNSNTLKHVDFMWLLQGKDDYKKEYTYYHNRSNYSKEFSAMFQNSSGIVQMTPKSGDQEFDKIVNLFING